MEPASFPRQPQPPKKAPVRRSAASRHRRVSLCETLDRVLNKGAIIAGDIVISVADVELLYLNLGLVVTSVETMRAWAGDSSDRLLERTAARFAAATGKPSVQPEVRN